MSNLKPVEKKRFEDLFGMSSGYVLDFNNSQFGEVFRQSVKTDIYSNKYSFNGDSKAKRLRAFWELESDLIVGRVLSELLEVYEYQNSFLENSPEDFKLKECQKIAFRLTGKKNNEANPEKEFLERDFGSISLNNLKVDSSLIPILENRLKDVKLGLKSGASLSVIFLCGSILEGILLGAATQNPQLFNQSSSSPKNKDGKVKQFQEWTLSNFIDVAYEIDLLRLDVKKFSTSLRDFRNYIHPYEQLMSKFQPDEHTAKISYQVLNAAIVCLSGDRN
jgi:hypothetical protein